MALTDKERLFAQLIVDGEKTQYEAYLTAYDVKTDKRESIDTMASVVANKPHVKEYMEKLRQRKEDAMRYIGVSDREKRLNLIWERIGHCIDKDDDAAISRYLTELGKLQGDYINITKDISDEKPLEKLTESDLRALLGKDEK